MHTQIHVSVAGRDGVHLHCGREGLFQYGLEFSATDCGYFEAVNGRLHCGNLAVFVYLSDVNEGDGGLLVGALTSPLNHPLATLSRPLSAVFVSYYYYYYYYYYHYT